MKKDSVLEKAFYGTLTFLLFFAAGYALLEPNMQGRYGYHDLNTLGRLVGWLGVNLGWAIYSMNHELVNRSRRFVLRGLPHWKFCFFGLLLVGFIFGSMGFLTGKNYGLEHTVSIHGPLSRLAEGIYAAAACFGYFLYKKNRKRIDSYMNELIAKKDKEDQ